MNKAHPKQTAQVEIILRVFGPGAVIVYQGPAPCAVCALEAKRKAVRHG